jgi:hypothetical protein
MKIMEHMRANSSHTHPAVDFQQDKQKIKPRVYRVTPMELRTYTVLQVTS